MDIFSEALNNLLVDTYRSVLKVEEMMIKSINGVDLSINELHMLEYVGKNKNEGVTISNIARLMDVTLPSITVAINKLEKKGFIRKEKRNVDGRTVHVVLTREGKRIDAVHRFFHEQMIRSVVRDIPDDEKNVLLNAMLNLDVFFKKQLEGMRQQSAK